MRVLICGSRNWADEDAILTRIFKLPDKSVIIHGACLTGADVMADKLGKQLLYDIEPYPADWDRLGLKAGVIRNSQMLKEGKPDQVWAFTYSLTGGTGDMVKKARRAGVPECRWKCLGTWNQST